MVRDGRAGIPNLSAFKHITSGVQHLQRYSEKSMSFLLISKSQFDGRTQKWSQHTFKAYCIYQW